MSPRPTQSKQDMQGYDLHLKLSQSLWSIICTTLDICSNILSQHFQSHVAQMDQKLEYINWSLTQDDDP